MDSDIIIALKSKRISIKVKTGRPETKINGIEKGVLSVEVHAKPKENEANIDILKYFKRLLGKPVRIVSGMKSREKMIEILE